MRHAISRRSVIGGMAGIGFAATTPLRAAPASPPDPVDALVKEVMSRPRAVRDGDEPPYDDTAVAISLPDNSPDFSQETARRSRDLLKKAEALRSQPLSASSRETLDILTWDLECDVGLAPFYWHDFPIGYRNSQIAQLSNWLGEVPPGVEIQTHVSLLRQAPTYVENIRLKLLGAHARGLTPPRTEAVRALAQLRTDRDRLLASLSKVRDNVAKTSGGAAAASEIDKITRGPLGAALEALVAAFEGSYIKDLDETSRMGFAPDAPEYYQALTKLRLSNALPLASTHELAVESLAAIDADLSRMRRSLGGSANAAEFHQAIAKDPRWLAKDVPDLTRRLNSAADEIRPLAARYFEKFPSTPFTLEPLPEALNMTLPNGTYSRPAPGKPKGTYFFNTSRLDVTTWIWAKPLIAHEVFPGHHLQFALMFEKQDVSPYRRATYVQGFVEGWGEHARDLMEEAGLYENDPWGLYASRLLERRFALRSAVETGLYRPDWTWQQAERDLATDPLTRPGTTQQLALAAATFRSNGTSYWWGLRQFRNARRKAEAAAGTNFNLKAFHARVMRGDDVPFDLLERRALS